jgi:hypothetical protein
MYLKKTHLPILFILLILSCKPNKKTAQHAKHIPSHKDTIVLKGNDTLRKKVDIAIIDTNSVLSAFKITLENKQFMKELDFDSQDKLTGSIFDSERPILIGDLNGDKLNDGIMPFSIEGREGGNNWEAYYAIFINVGGKLEYKYSFSRGGDLSEKQIDFKRIKDGFIQGMEVPGNKFPDGDSTSVKYMYRETDLSEVLTASDAK